MQPDCARPPTPLLLAGVAQFNAGEYFVCHETFEELWLAERAEVRRLYQGILQIAAALHHLQRGNEGGALTLLSRGADLLRFFGPECQGLDVAALLTAAESLRRRLETQGLEAARVSGAYPRLLLIGSGEALNSDPAELS